MKRSSRSYIILILRKDIAIIEGVILLLAIIVCCAVISCIIVIAYITSTWSSLKNIDVLFLWSRHFFSHRHRRCSLSFCRWRLSWWKWRRQSRKWRLMLKTWIWSLQIILRGMLSDSNLSLIDFFIWMII